MRIPYNRVHVHGDILFAAQSGQIHTFKVVDGHHISVWKHPDVAKVADAIREVAQDEVAAVEVGANPTMDVDEKDDIEPPAKRQRKAETEDVGNVPENPNDDAPAGSEEPKKRRGKKAKNRNKGERSGPPDQKQSNRARVPDRPVVTHLTSTTDGKHVVAITGHDKTIWVFEHDGAGNLTQIGQRAMPKRPSALQVTQDTYIISADKFGDVYALPLIPDPDWVPVHVERAAYKPQATPLTVHSKRNLDSLRAQQKQTELRTERQQKDQPAFEMTLLLGHVSMLTDLLVAEQRGRRYILTSDRDEHIRVSRYMPQAHIIESFCLGHKDFIGAMTIPSSKGELLVSGGGDTELFVWDWIKGSLLSRASLLSLAQEIAPATTKIAVSGLYSLEAPSGRGNLTYILAICEDIKAIFSWQLTSANELHCPSIIQLPGSPLHLSVTTSSDGLPRVFAALDPGEESPAKSINVYSLEVDEDRLVVATASTVSGDTFESADLEATPEEIRNLLYSYEYLRKQTGEGVEAEKADADQE